MNEIRLTGSEPEEYRALLGAFATGITVLTTVGDDGPIGMTASAVSAVSLDPPLLLVCVSREGRLNTILSAGKPFALSILADDQETLSQRFAADGDPFDATRCEAGPGDGLPLIENAAAHIVCATWDTHEAGDHTVVFGRVDGGQVYDRRPLIHHRSRYTTTRD